MAMHRIPSVRDFGALGDGVTDDSDAFNAAMQQALPGGEGHLLFVPPGVYKLTRNLRLRSEMHLLGAGGGNEKTRLLFGADAGIVIDSQYTSRPFGGGIGAGSVVEGLRISGTINVVPSVWQADTRYAVGDRVHMWVQVDPTSHKKLIYRSFYWECVRAGISGGPNPPAINSSWFSYFRIPYADLASVPAEFPPWQAWQSYQVGDYVSLQVGDYVSLQPRYDVILQCTKDGKSGRSVPRPATVDSSITDNEVTWLVRSASLYFWDEGPRKPAWAARVHAGVRVHTRAWIKHCVIENFVNAGLWIQGDTAPVGPGSNAIGWLAEKVNIAASAIGIFVRGVDAHVGTAISCEATDIGLILSHPLRWYFRKLVDEADEDGACGFCDRSYYGNTWLSCVADGSTDRSYLLEGAAQGGAIIGCWGEGEHHPSFISANNILIGGWVNLNLANLDERSSPAAVQRQEFREVWEVNRKAGLQTTAKLLSQGADEVFAWSANDLDPGKANYFGWRHKIAGLGEHEWTLSYQSGSPTPFLSVADGFAADGTSWRDYHGHLCGPPVADGSYFLGVGPRAETALLVRRGRRVIGDRFEAGEFISPRGKYLGRIVTQTGYRSQSSTWSPSINVNAFNELMGFPPGMIETASGKVFACVKRGKTGGTEPTWTGAVKPSAHFAAPSWIKAWEGKVQKLGGWRVRPTTPNGYYYKCQRGGFTGPTEPLPTEWPSPGQTLMDAETGPDARPGVVWEFGGTDTPPASLIRDNDVLWEYVGDLPTFADYGPVYEKATVTTNGVATTTLDAYPTDTYPTDGSGTTHCDVVVTAFRTDSGNEDGMSFVLRGAWKRIGSGNPVALGTVSVDSRGTAGWTATLALVGSNVEVQVTGAPGATIVWNSTRRPK